MATDTFTAYTELGLAPGATEREAKAAWRRLVSQWHPDRNPGPGAVGRMQRLNQALDALRRAGFPGHHGPAQPAPEPARPASPDAAQPQAPGPGAAPPEAADPAAGGTTSDRAGDKASDKNDDKAGDRSGDRAGETTGATGTSARTLRRQVRLTLEEAALGCTRVLTGKASPSGMACAACTGAGWLQPGGDCATCHGAGALRQPGWFGLFGNASACAACGGSGVARVACGPCAGSGRRAQPGYRVSVRLPAGVRDGDTLTVAAHRMPRSQSPVELLIRVRVQPHAVFTLGDDGTVYCSLPVNGWAWMANRSVPLATLAGPHSVRLDRNVRQHRLAGRGFPVRRGGACGDLLVTVLPQFPAVLSTDQQILLDQLVATGVG